MLLQDHAFFFTPVLTTQLVLIQLLINGNKLLKLLSKDNSTHSSIPLTKVSCPETSIKMEKVLDISLHKDLKWSLPNPSLKSWDFTEKELELFISFAETKLKLERSFHKSKLSSELTTHLHQSTVPESLLSFSTTSLSDNNG